MSVSRNSKKTSLLDETSTHTKYYGTPTKKSITPNFVALTSRTMIHLQHLQLTGVVTNRDNFNFIMRFAEFE